MLVSQVVGNAETQAESETVSPSQKSGLTETTSCMLATAPTCVWSLDV